MVISPLLKIGVSSTRTFKKNNSNKNCQKPEPASSDGERLLCEIVSSGPVFKSAVQWDNAPH